MKETKHQQLSAAILAGGKASRLGGTAKGALICPNRLSIIQQLISVLHQADIAEIIIISNDQKSSLDYNINQFSTNCGLSQRNIRRNQLKIISDLRSGIGPLAGIESAMNYFKNKYDAALFLPCDMPKITSAEIAKLKENFLLKNSPIVFAKTCDHNHYLFSIAHNNLLKNISHKIDEGERRVGKVWGELNAKPIFFENEKAFLNINTPIDLKRFYED